MFQGPGILITMTICQHLILHNVKGMHNMVILRGPPVSWVAHIMSRPRPLVLVCSLCTLNLSNLYASMHIVGMLVDPPCLRYGVYWVIISIYGQCQIGKPSKKSLTFVKVARGGSEGVLSPTQKNKIIKGF